MANESHPQSTQLDHLRALAQHHLTEIEREKFQEERQSSQAEADIMRYSKLSSAGRRKQQSAPSAQQGRQPSPEQSAAETSPDGVATKPKFRPFQDILHRLRWDPTLHIDEYVVGYLERFEGIKEMGASSWIRDFSDEEWIPMHRVRYVKRIRNTAGLEGEVDGGPAMGLVWDRDTRVDKISAFGTKDALDEEGGEGDLLSRDGTSVTGGMPL